MVGGYRGLEGFPYRDLSGCLGVPKNGQKTRQMRPFFDPPKTLIYKCNLYTPKKGVPGNSKKCPRYPFFATAPLLRTVGEGGRGGQSGILFSIPRGPKKGQKRAHLGGSNEGGPDMHKKHQKTLHSRQFLTPLYTPKKGVPGNSKKCPRYPFFATAPLLRTV